MPEMLYKLDPFHCIRAHLRKMPGASAPVRGGSGLLHMCTVCVLLLCKCLPQALRALKAAAAMC